MRILIAVCFTISTFSLWATDYYVSPSGNDSNSGSIGSPWKTIQFATDQLVAGDNLYLRAGTYFEKIDLNVSGASGNRITISNYQNEIVKIDGTGNTSVVFLLRILNQNYITIQGIHFTNNVMLDAQGILVSGNCDGIYLLDNKISEINFSSTPNSPATPSTNAQGIIVYGTNGSNSLSDLKINGNEVFDCMLGYSEALAVNGNVDGFEVLDNYVHDNTNIGIDIIGHEGEAPANDQARNGLIKDNIVHDCVSSYATSGGIYVDGGKDLIIENNVTYKNGYGIEVGCENSGKTTSNIIIRNNLIYNNVTAGLSLGGFDYPNSGKVVDCSVTGNTFYQNDSSNSFLGEFYLSYSENCIITSNIIYLNSNNTFAYTELSQPNIVVDYNNIFLDTGAANFEVSWNGTFYFGYANYLNGTGNDANSIFGDPLFLDENILNPDLHLQIGSAAIDNGDPTYVPDATEVDLDGHVRINNTIMDCGADEFGSSSGGGCPNDYAGINKLTGTQSVSDDFETDGIIDSDQIINGNAVVDYDSAVEINLLIGFEVILGVSFNAFIDGCGNLLDGGKELNHK